MNTLRTSLIIFRRSLRFTLRNPAWVVMSLIQPLLYLVLFGPLLAKLAAVPGFGANPWRVFVPGLLVQQSVFASAFVGFGVIAEIRSGVLDRMRVTAAGELGLLLGRVMRDAVVYAVQGGLLVLGAVGLGLRASLAGVVLSFVLLCVLGLAMSALSYGLALRIPAEDVFGQLINAVTLPTLLLSGVLLPMTLAPGWLSGLSRANPLTHVVTGVRELFDGRLASSGTLTGAAVALGLAALTVWFGLRSVRSADR
ncbi:ABC transporter permease [Kitasatospora sp. NPDC048365]|uniref:ABC transporter permease n=1 Tax=Kitasatospora sp. NPDC048365 TaxID=3364050 RepID=UPI0037212AEB